MCSLKGRLISEKEEVVCMFVAIPVREIGNPHDLRVSPDNLEETIDYYELTDDEKGKAVAAARKVAEICIVKIEGAGLRQRFITVKGCNTKSDYDWAPSYAGQCGPPPRYALFNARRERPGRICYSDSVFAFVDNNEAEHCWFRGWFEFCPGEVG